MELWQDHETYYQAELSNDMNLMTVAVGQSSLCEPCR